jgi:bacterioferritin-associated ferredoxin
MTKIITDEEVQDAIRQIRVHQRIHQNKEPYMTPMLDAAIDLIISRALSAYRKPSADQDEIDRAIAIFQEHIDEAKKIVGHKPDCKYCEASTLAITALRRMAGEGK